jgi:uncharacterized protein (UPF0335 family)
VMGNNTAARLRQGIEAIESFDAEIDELKERIKGLKADRKGTMDQTRADTGFVPKVQEQIVRERKMDPASRGHFATQLQLARGVMGMLDGTPLGDAARKAFEKPPPAPSDTWVADDRQDEFPEIPDQQERPKAITEEDIKQARQAGVDAAQAGLKVTDNPYPAEASKLRAAWDEGWCSENGSDGMDIPEELRRKPKKAAGEGNDNQQEDRDREAA